MSPLQTISASGCDPNTPLLTKPQSNPSISHRSSSVKPSMRSSRSRITLVGYDAELEPKIDVMYGTTNNAKEFSWFDHLLAVFCIARRPKFESLQATASIQLPEPKDRETYLDSPWVLPVHVLSTKRDEHRHLIPKEAKCTIDTSNFQGNIVSRAFLVDVLGYSEANFLKLTKEEESGGTGITDHKLIPEGAIYLTWYHSSSTRVFRDMRFLISEHPVYNLIIGARSIRKNNILDVPNLMTGNVISTTHLKTYSKIGKKLEELESQMIKSKKALMDLDFNLKKQKFSKNERKERCALEQKIYEVAQEAYNDACQAEYIVLIRDAEKEGHDQKSSELRDEYNGMFPSDKDKLPEPQSKEGKDKHI